MAAAPARGPRARRALAGLAGIAGLAVASIIGCASDAASPVDPQPASLRMYAVASGRELTPLPALPRGATTRVELRWFAADGGRIRGLEARHDARLDFDVESAVATPVAGTAFQYDVAVQPAAQAASLFVTYRTLGETTGTAFGPFATTFP